MNGCCHCFKLCPARLWLSWQPKILLSRWLLQKTRKIYVPTNQPQVFPLTSSIYCIAENFQLRKNLKISFIYTFWRYFQIRVHRKFRLSILNVALFWWIWRVMTKSPKFLKWLFLVFEYSLMTTTEYSNIRFWIWGIIINLSSCGV